MQGNNEIIFGTMPNCHQCSLLKAKLDDIMGLDNIPDWLIDTQIKIIDLSIDEQLRNHLSSLGARSAPVLFDRRTNKIIPLSKLDEE